MNQFRHLFLKESVLLQLDHAFKRMLVDALLGIWPLNVIQEQDWMVADLAQNVDRCERCVRVRLILVILAEELLDVVQVGLVEVELRLGHVAGHDVLVAHGQLALLLQLLLRSPQEVVAHAVPELLRHLLRHFFLSGVSPGVSAFHDGFAVLTFEEFERAQQLWLYEVEEAPELLEAVFHRCPA